MKGLKKAFLLMVIVSFSLASCSLGECGDADKADLSSMAMGSLKAISIIGNDTIRISEISTVDKGKLLCLSNIENGSLRSSIYLEHTDAGPVIHSVTFYRDGKEYGVWYFFDDSSLSWSASDIGENTLFPDMKEYHRQCFVTRYDCDGHVAARGWCVVRQALEYDTPKEVGNWKYYDRLMVE